MHRQHVIYFLTDSSKNMSISIPSDMPGYPRSRPLPISTEMTQSRALIKASYETHDNNDDGTTKIKEQVKLNPIQHRARTPAKPTFLQPSEA